VIFHPIHKTTSQTLSRPSKFLSSGCTTIITTGNPGFAEGQKLSAKATKHPAKSLPRVALGKGPTGIFFSATILCRALELKALGIAFAESL
jgi:hypothetical protein